MARLYIYRGREYEQQHRLDRLPVILGRAEGTDLRLRDSSVSRRHAVVRPGDGGWWIEDLGSTNRTLLNGRQIESSWLMDGDVLVMGGYQLRFVDQHAHEAPAGPRRPA